MATYGYLPPAPVLDGHSRTPDAQNLPFTGTINLDDVLILSAGVLAKAATNAAVTTLAGCALKKSADIYASTSPSDATLFGASTLGTVLTNGYPLNMDFYPLEQGTYIEMSYVQAVAATTPGTAVGLTLDATSTYFVADNTQTNKIGTIVAVRSDAISPYTTGDIGARVVVQINAATAIG